MAGQVERKPKVVVIVGPNASGKSELAVELALKFNGEIVSADSRQIYRGLNLTSGKVPGAWRRIGIKRRFVYQDIPHHMTDMISPRKHFTVQEFRKKAGKAIDGVIKRGKLPVVEGGSGFYVDVLLHDIEIPEVPPNRRLRRELGELDDQALLNRLKALDAHTAKRIDQHNRYRVIRAIEIIVTTHSPIPEIQLKNLERSHYDLLKIGLLPPVNELKRRIKNRLERRLKEGMVQEVKGLRRKRISWKRLEELGLEFRYISRHLRGELAYEKMVSTLETQIWR
ncbi:MAG: tRNA (adenosine(37)-N6)-dimethylallyltransferase MiaA, partial [Candidatus Colwellbacteria bacterium]|nr:tRNA (adenosine(37)-N6)-dimethylallyltransferase MiaA [Candidatus Colwellbacteria bacterium]